MDSPFALHPKVSLAVMKEFAEFIFPDWQAVIDFTMHRIQTYAGPLDETDVAGFFKHTRDALSGPHGLEVGNYMTLLAGANYLSAIGHPFPERTETTTPEEAGLVLIIPLAAGLRLDAAHKALGVVQEEGLETNSGREAADSFYRHLLMLKKLAPGTTLKTFAENTPPTLLQPAVRHRINELANLAFSGKAGFTVVQGRIVSLQ